MSEGIIRRIDEITGKQIQPIASLEGTGGRLGVSQMLSALTGAETMDGYAVETDQHTYHVLIDNEQSCCESWGYFASEDDLTAYVGAELREVRLTNTALNTERVEASGYYGYGEDESDDGGGIQFVDFVTDRGTFQLAVYNGHNGYYGHGIIVAKDSDVLLNDTI